MGFFLDIFVAIVIYLNLEMHKLLFLFSYNFVICF